MTEELPSPAPRGRGAARAEAFAHPLFPAEVGEKPVPIAWLQLRRYTENGPIDHQRMWPASEIQGPDDIFQWFGGGHYEIWGRAPQPNGSPGAIVKKVRLTLDGPSKPFVAIASSAAPLSPAAAGGTSATDTFMQLMMADRAEQRAREDRAEERRMREDERRQAREEQRSAQTMALFGQALGALGGIVTAILQRPPPPAPAPPPPGPDLMPLLARLIPEAKGGDELERLGKLLDVAKKVTPEKGATESLPELLSGFGEAMGGIAAMEAARAEQVRAGIVPAPTINARPSAPPGNGNGNAPAPPPAIVYSEPPDDPSQLRS